MEQLSLPATATEAHVPQLLKPARLQPVLHNKRSHHNEKLAHSNKEQPPLDATRGSPLEAMKTQCRKKKKSRLVVAKGWSRKKGVWQLLVKVYGFS